MKRFITIALTGALIAATPAPLLIASKGVQVTPAQARARLSFHPYVPPGIALLATALIPPLFVDRRNAMGFAVEYRRSGDVLLLSEWPMAGAPLDSHRPCAPAVHERGNVLWTTRTGLVMTLQPDGAVPAPRILREARRLAAGACGSRG